MTDTYYEVYDNERWNFSVRVKPEVYASSIYTSSADNKYILEFYGINMDAGTLKNEFALSSSLDGTSTNSKLLIEPRRIYAGSHRLNFTGSTILESTDVKIASVKYWGAYLEDEELQSHLRDPQSYGREAPYNNQYLYLDTLDDVKIPQIDTLFETASILSVPI